jgi:retron-type reverse transcriptase
LIENQQQVVSITEDDHRRVQLNNTNLQSLQQCPTLSNNNIEDWKQKESQSLERVLKELKNGTFEISC